MNSNNWNLGALISSLLESSYLFESTKYWFGKRTVSAEHAHNGYVFKYACVRVNECASILYIIYYVCFLIALYKTICTQNENVMNSKQKDKYLKIICILFIN